MNIFLKLQLVALGLQLVSGVGCLYCTGKGWLMAGDALLAVTQFLGVANILLFVCFICSL